MRISLILTLVLSLSISAQSLIEKIAADDETLLQILQNREKYELQIIYTQIDRDENNNPKFTTHKFNVDPGHYFYPASSVKFPAAVLALEKLNELNIPELNKFTQLKIDSIYSGQSSVMEDPTSKNGTASIAHYIKKILLVSDNDAYNRLYEFLGQEQLNKGLWSKGYKDVKLNHRLSIFLSDDENRHTNPFTFYNDEKIIYEQPPQCSELKFDFELSNIKRGKGFFNGGKLIEEPMDFSQKNYISLETLHNILKAVIFPNAVDPSSKFNLTNSDYKFLYKFMSMLPRESDYPDYSDYEHYPDGYVKFFMYGDTDEKMPENIRILNKVGLAYGFMIDNAYIVDFDNGVEFLLSAVIYVNEDQIYNDDKYEYDEVGLPFLSRLGRAVYEYELQRSREFEPNLIRFDLNRSLQK